MKIAYGNQNSVLHIVKGKFRWLLFHWKIKGRRGNAYAGSPGS